MWSSRRPFLAHEEQLAALQLQCSAVYKLPAEGHLSVQLQAAVTAWKHDHKPGVAHPVGACHTAVTMVLLQELSQSSPPAGCTAEELKPLMDLIGGLLASTSPATVAREVSHCSARLTAKKTHLILDLRPALSGRLMQHFASLCLLLDSYEGEKLGRKPAGALARRARNRQ